MYINAACTLIRLFQYLHFSISPPLIQWPIPLSSPTLEIMHVKVDTTYEGMFSDEVERGGGGEGEKDVKRDFVGAKLLHSGQFLLSLFARGI